METQNTNSQVPIVDQSAGQAVRFTDEELQILGKINARYQEKIFQFGQLYLERNVVNDRITELNKLDEKLRQEYLMIQKDEEDTLNKLTEKYGEGSLDIKTGTFTPKK